MFANISSSPSKFIKQGDFIPMASTSLSLSFPIVSRKCFFIFLAIGSVDL